MAATTCTGEPISWLRLERMALGARDAAAAEHVLACEACRACLESIRGDEVALPPLVVPARAPARPWLRSPSRWLVPASGLALAAAALLLWTRPAVHGTEPGRVATVKGAGEVVLDVARERGGTVAVGASTFRPGDRWKLVVTCAPGAAAWVDVAVVEAGSRAAPDHPLPPARVACGNGVVVPGAFTVTGPRPNRICAVLGADAPPPRGPLADADEGSVACVSVAPE